MKDLKGSICITRPSGYNTDHISIEIKDENSRVSFLKVSLSFESFAKAITGQSYMPIEFSTNRLELVGKIKESKTLTFPVGEVWSKQRNIAEQTCQDFADEGWTAINSFNSQDSFFDNKEDGGKAYAKTYQIRYVDRPKEGK